MENMRDIIVITGPTASGKSKAATDLAQKIGGEIISADSLQVYKYMDIGTAKEINPPVKHHLIDIITPGQKFSAADYVKHAQEAINNIPSHITPIVAGGSGFYINALLYKTDLKSQNSDYLNFLNEKLENAGKEALHQMLVKVDAPYAEKVHFNNTRKVIRALEYYYSHGKRLSDQKRGRKNYNITMYLLDLPRHILYEKINNRVDLMLEKGLVREVENLVKMGYANTLPLQSIGYKEILKYLNREYTLDEAREKIKQNTRRFAKRQLTWFKNKTEAQPVNLQSLLLIY